jgi:PAS domain S-box-containing protein
LGHQVREAADGAEALKVLQAGGIDLVISDILMPNMDGYRFCYEVRNNPLLSKLPIILYSSTYLTPSDRDLGLKFGANAFLEKPAPPEQLAGLIEEVTRAPNAAKPSQVPEDLGVLKQYSERLIKKIEEKNLELLQRTAELEEAQQKFRQMAENIGEVFWVATRGITKVIYVSPGYERIWGRPCQEVYDDARAWLWSVLAEDRPAIIEAIEQDKYSNENGYHEEFRIVRPDGSVRWILNRAFPVRDSSGKIYRNTGICTDVTDRKNLEGQFRQAQKMEAVGRLAGGVAHDFNNLLTVINGYSQLILHKLDERDPIYHDLDEIQKAGIRAADLTRQLLTFSRKQVIRPQVINLNVAIVELEKLLKRLIGEDVVLVTELKQDLGNVRADLSQIEQIIVNLSVNARDAMPKGGKLTIATSNIDLEETNTTLFKGLKPGAYIQISITDTGTGMTDEVKNRVFEPFFTTKEPGKGTGLGLSTVYGIVHQSGGYVGVYSEVGKGSCFKVYLPRVEAPADARKRAASKAASPRGTETILVVEDQEVVRLYIGFVLRSNGYTVKEASHGGEALLLSERLEGKIDLILTDIVMPEMSGPALVKRLTKQRQGVKAMYMSGYPDSTIVHQEDLDPNAVFLDKPFTPGQLLHKVREALDTTNRG